MVCSRFVNVYRLVKASLPPEEQETETMKIRGQGACNDCHTCPPFDNPMSDVRRNPTVAARTQGGVMNRQAAWRAVGAGLLVCALLVYGWNARSQTGDPPPTGHFVTFDPPGSTSTVPSAITAARVVVGSYIDSSGAQHGFLRNANGSFITFDPPGSTLTTATAINPAGTVTGPTTTRRA
jgi:hypothetical protein